MAAEENSVAAGWLAFDRVEIDLAGRRVFVDDVQTPLEPKAFAVLALLARHPGRAFARDDILDAVWGHTHITPGVLNRIITLLRQSLGENPEGAQYIHTLHGIGYRFDASVTAAAQRRVAANNAHAANREPPAPARTVDDIAAPAPASAPAPAQTLPRKDDADATAATTEAKPARRRVVGASIVLLLVVLALAGAWLRRLAPAAAPATLVVLPLRTIGEDRSESAFAEGLSEELTTRLAHIEGLSLISSNSAALAQQRKLDFAQLAQQLHVSHAIEGSLRQAGDQLRIDLRLVEIPNGRTLWAQDYDRKLADVFAIQSEVAQAVAGALALRLGLATKAEGDVDVAQYREYLGLRSTLLKPEFTSGTPKQNAAREALRALIVRAPGYARAHGLLARSLSAQVTPSFNPSAAQLDDAAREAALALKLDADNSDAHATLAELACRRTDWETCIEEYRRALALDPADVATRGRYALRLSGIGYVDAALREFDTAHRSDPLETTVSWQRARILDTLGRHDEAKDAEESGIKQGVIPQQPAAYSRWHNAVWRHDYAQAREVAAQMPEQDGFREAYMAVTQALQNATLWPQALTAIGESERRTGHYNFARLLGPCYDARAVFASFEPMLRDGFPSYSLLVWQAEYAALRRDPAFQDYIRRNHILDYWRTHDFPPQCQPDGDGARCGDPGSATSAAVATALAPVTASGKSPTLVVLPLRQAGKQHDEAVLAEGVSEELTTRLARVDGLNLISSTSAALAQERKLDPEQLAEQLRVDHVLEGSLRDKGDSLHVELRLAEVPGGKTLWTQDYDRPLAKLPALEGEIAQAVASALALRPAATDRADAASVDPALLRRVIEARSVLRNPGAHPGQSAEAMARAVLEEHPDYGPALGQHALILELQFKSPEDAAVGRREAERAIQLDPNDTEARVALAYAAAHEADWEQALAMYRTALQLAPADSVYRAGYGTMLAGLGYLDEGMRQSDIGVAYDPLGFVATSRRAEMLDTLGRHDEAKRQLDATLASTPGANPAYRRWLNAAWRHDAAGLQAALAAMPDKNAWKDSYRIATAALFDARLWPQTHAAIEESEQRARAQGDAGGFNFLRLMEPQPDYVKTFAGLGAGLRRNFPYYFLMVWMPEYRAARQSPPFQDFIKRNHVLDYWRAHGFPPQCKPDGDGAKCD